MAIEFKPSMKKDELLEIAVLNGIAADDSMTRAQIMDALKAAGAAQTAEQPESGPQSGAEDGGTSGQGNDTPGGENAVQSGTEGQQDAPGGGAGENENGGDGAGDGEAPTDGPQSGTEDSDGAGEDNNTTQPEKPLEGKQEAPQGYNLFVYAGPSLPRGRLKENTVFRGTFEDVKNYLSDALEDYPQIEKLIVPADKLAAFSVKVKTPGNIVHKHYGDIVSAMRGNKEV